MGISIMSGYLFYCLICYYSLKIILFINKRFLDILTAIIFEEIFYEKIFNLRCE